MIESMGGCCQICGYDRCESALHFHHLDPNEKDFGFAQIRASIKAWATIVEELRKCVLLCGNCHAEVHDDLVTVPKDAARFDERYLDYKKMLKDEQKRTCPVCQEDKLFYGKTCSKQCAGKLRGKIDWDAIDLIALKETKTFQEIGDMLGCSDAAVRKRYKIIAS